MLHSEEESESDPESSVCKKKYSENALSSNASQSTHLKDNTGRSVFLNIFLQSDLVLWAFRER